jgi:predicted transglutaminase-like cysteine proteinase
MRNKFDFFNGLKKNMVWGCLLLVALVHTHSHKAQAASIKDVPAQIKISTSDHFNTVAAYPRLFASTEKRSSSLKEFTKWSGMFGKFDRQLAMNSSMPVIQKFQSDLRGLQGLPLNTMAARVNDMMNAKNYITDKRNWGTNDYWATPVEFLQRGGDCEDFAIAKYTALRMLGVPEERLRVAIVHDNLKNIAHAILIVYTDGGAIILDNQEKSVLDGNRAGRYRPIYSINRTAWWLHTADSETRVASR